MGSRQASWYRFSDESFSLTCSQLFRRILMNLYMGADVDTGMDKQTRRGQTGNTNGRVNFAGGGRGMV